MAILVVGEAASVTAEQDTTLVKRLYLEGSPPAGARIRMAGPTGGGWRIVTLWDSEADWERFRNDMLAPALADIGHAVSAVAIWQIETVHTF